jgi:hypothetical protein
MLRVLFRRRLGAAAGWLLVTACGEAAPRTAADSQAAHVAEVIAAGGTVDSILPIDEQLRRFREGMQPVDTLRHASPSQEALVRRFLVALTRRDTAALNALVIDRAEFAYLYYPGSALSLPPYEAPPQLLWGQILASSNEGVAKALTRVGGAGISLETIRCPAPPVAEGGNRLHQNCEIHIRIGDRPPETGRWFGTIVEREGRYKLLGLANAL